MNENFNAVLLLCQKTGRLLIFEEKTELPYRKKKSRQKMKNFFASDEFFADYFFTDDYFYQQWICIDGD